jgi:hypothetical protein
VVVVKEKINLIKCFPMTSKEFVDTINNEFDIETLELMKELIDKKLVLLKTMQDTATKTKIKGFGK